MINRAIELLLERQNQLQEEIKKAKEEREIKEIFVNSCSDVEEKTNLTWQLIDLTRLQTKLIESLIECNDYIILCVDLNFDMDNLLPPDQATEEYASLVAFMIDLQTMEISKMQDEIDIVLELDRRYDCTEDEFERLAIQAQLKSYGIEF
jgi:hypothetical protein